MYQFDNLMLLRLKLKLSMFSGLIHTYKIQLYKYNISKYIVNPTIKM